MLISILFPHSLLGILKILKNFSKNWPKHERPESWIIGKNQSNYIKKSNFIFEK